MADLESLFDVSSTVDAATASTVEDPSVGAVAVTLPAGSFDLISEEGWALGWAWYPHAPDERVVIELLIDGEVAGVTVAASHRGDVAAAGMGDGNCGFSWALPYAVMTRSRETLIAARDQKTGHMLPEPRLFQPRGVANALEKIAGLEADLRQLNATIALMAGRAAADERSAAELFKTVGDFFVRLAESTSAGEPPGSIKTLKDAVADITGTYRPILFDVVAAPDISICVNVTAPFDETYRQLKAIHDHMGPVRAEVILVDNGAEADAPLLPLVVRNARYIRLKALTQTVQCNEIALAAAANLIVFLNGTVPTGPFLPAVVTAFSAIPGLVALAAKVSGPDGLLEHAGVTIEAGQARPRGRRFAADEAAYRNPQPVDAVAPEAFAVRRDNWKALHGLRDAYAGLGPALADFCLRATSSGHVVIYDPEFALTQSGADYARPLSVETRQNDEARLRQAMEEFRETDGAV